MSLSSAYSGMSAVASEFQVAIDSIKDRAPERFVDAVIWQDFVHDRVSIRTEFVLVTRRDMDDARNSRHLNSLVAARVLKAIGISDDPSQQAKRLRTERRQLLARGKEAASRKARLA
jgi:hypothetical protein